MLRTPVTDFADLQKRIYAAVNNVTPQMINNIWVEVEYRLDIPCASNGSHVEVYGHKVKKLPVSLLVEIGFVYRLVIVWKSVAILS